MGLAASGDFWGNTLCRKLAMAGPFRVVRYDSRDTGRSTHFASDAHAKEKKSDDSGNTLIDGRGVEKEGGRNTGNLSRVHPSVSERPSHASNLNDIDDLFGSPPSPRRERASDTGSWKTHAEVDGVRARAERSSPPRQQEDDREDLSSTISARSIFQIIQALRNPSHLPLPAFYHMDDLTNDALSLLRALRLGEGGRGVHLVGYCLGGIVAQCMVIRAPAQVRSLTLIATHTSEPGRVQWPSLRHMLGFVRYIPKEMISSSASSSSLLPSILSRWPLGFGGAHRGGEADISAAAAAASPEARYSENAATHRSQVSAAEITTTTSPSEPWPPRTRQKMQPYITSVVHFLRHISGDQTRYPFDTAKMERHIRRHLSRWREPRLRGAATPSLSSSTTEVHLDAQSSSSGSSAGARADSGVHDTESDETESGATDKGERLNTTVRTSRAAADSTRADIRPHERRSGWVTNASRAATDMSHSSPPTPFHLLRSVVTHLSVAINAPGRDAALRRCITSVEPESSRPSWPHAATVVSSRVYIPTLIIHGSQDILCPPANAAHLAQVIEGSRLVLISGMGHTLLPQLSDEYVGYLSDTIRRGEVAYARRTATPVAPSVSHL